MTRAFLSTPNQQHAKLPMSQAIHSVSSAAPGFRVSPSPLFDPAPYAAELDVYVAGLLALMRSDESPGSLRAFHAEFGIAVPSPSAAAALVAQATAEELRDLFDLSLHGIFKHLGSGGVCCLLKVDPAVMAFGAGASASASSLRSSWDSVNFLSPLIVEARTELEPATPSWLHRDARLGAAASECWQGLYNISPHAQDGPAGDASFVCIPGSHEDAEPAAEALAGVEPRKVEDAHKKDWVKAADFGDALTRGRGAERIAVCGGGGISWDSRLLHCGSLFGCEGRPHPRMVKYIYYFRAEEAVPACRKTHELMVKACTPQEGAEGLAEAAAACPLSRLPIAPTTPHRGNAKNSTGKLPTFRVTGRKRLIADKLNRLMDDPRVRPFFTLPHMVARALRLKHGGGGGGASLTELALAVMERLRAEPGQESTWLAKEPKTMVADIDALRRLHAAPPPEAARSRKRARKT
jgi:hypothetical protein